MSLLLIYPPFAHPRAPHLALPTLAAYLARAGVETRLWDANLDFFRELLTPENIDRGVARAEDELLELNGRDDLTPEQKARYLSLATLLQSLPPIRHDPARAFDREAGLSPMEREDAFRFGAVLASVPFYPEELVLRGNIPSVSHATGHDNFSTSGIMRGASAEGLLTGFFERSLPRFLEDRPPRLIGISVGVEDQIQPAFRCARAIKQLAPNIHVTLGGSFVSTSMREMDKPEVFRFFDSLILDDGEVPLETLARELATPKADFSVVPGMIYLEDGRIRRTPPADPPDLESLPAPDFRALPLDRYLMPGELMALPFRSSRGCYWRKCAFCRTETPIVRHHQQARAEYLSAVMDRVNRDTGASAFAFTDESSSPPVLEELARMLAGREAGYQWNTCLRMERTLTAERCAALARGGCVNVNFGLEAYNDRLLKLIGKGTNVETVHFVLENMARAGVYAFTYMMVGLPTETEAESRAGFQGLSWLRNKGFVVDFVYSIFQLFPDSLFHRRAGEFGITNIRPPEGRDLCGPIDDYEATGMSRKTAQRLSRLFNQAGAPDFGREVPIRGRVTPLRHDLARFYMEEVG